MKLFLMVILYGLISFGKLRICFCQLHIVPIGYSHGNIRTVPCDVTEGVAGEFHIIKGDKFQACSVEVTTTSMSINVTQLVLLNGNLTGTDYMYVQRLGDLNRCPNRYVVFRELAIPRLSFMLYQRRFQLSVRGDVSIGLGPSGKEEWEEAECMESQGHRIDPYCNDTAMTGCGDAVQGYDDVITLACYWKDCYSCYVYVKCCACNLSSSSTEMFNNDCHSRQYLPPPAYSFLKVFIIPAISENIDNNTLIQSGRLFNGLNSDTRELYLGLNHFQLIGVDVFRGLSNLLLLNLSSNGLQSLAAGVFRWLIHLTTLFLDGNALTSLPVGVFSGLSSLNLLDLNANNLQSLAVGVFSGLNNLTTLVLSENSLTCLHAGVFSELSNMMTLYLSYIKLQYISEGVFKGLQRLRLLDLYGNEGNLMIREDVFCDLSPDVVIYCECLYSDSTVYRCRTGNDAFTTQSSCRLLTHISVTVFMVIFGCGAILGNVFVLCWRRLHWHDENRVQTILLSNLAVSDLLMGIYMLTMAGADIVIGEGYYASMTCDWRYSIPCVIAGVLAFLASEASVFFITLISIDRFICIKYPFTIHRLRGKSTKIAVSIMWLLAFLLATTPYVLLVWFRTISESAFEIYRTTIYDSSDMCIGLPLIQLRTESNAELQPGMFYSVAVFLVLNLACFLVILGCYVEIIRAVKSSSREAQKSKRMQEQIRLTVKVAAIVATDFCCWFPIIIVGILGQSGAIHVSTTGYAMITTFVLPFNSTINPFLYTISYAVAERWRKRQNQHP